MRQKSRRAFSGMPLDQMHEQMVLWLENHDGALENMNNPNTVLREQVVCLELARLTN